MGNNTSGMHGDYVIARARKQESDSAAGCARDSMHSEHINTSTKDCSTPEHVLKKIDCVLDSAISNITTKKDGELPIAQNEEVTAEAVRCKEGLVDIMPSKRYLYDNTLFLCTQSIVEIAPCICRLKGLRILQGCCNAISQLPAQMCLLKNLRTLILSNNQIYSLPDNIGECTSLREINLSSNYLRSLPVSFSKLSRLCALDIASNRFASIPMCISNLSSLRYLNVERNHIKAVPIEILRLRSMVKFRFHGNHFVFTEGIEAATDMASLMELCARKVFSMRCSFNGVGALASFVRKAKKCSFCEGPFYERVYAYTDTQNTIFGTLPVYYRLCSRHFDTKKGKIEQTLGSSIHHDTAP